MGSTIESDVQDFQSMSGTQDSGQQQPQDGSTTPQEGGPSFSSYDDYYKSLPLPVRELLDGHIHGLKSALDSERSNRKSAAAKLKEMEALAASVPGLQEQLQAMATSIKTQETQASFYEAATAAGIKNLRLAWAAAQQFDEVIQDGEIDIEALKKAAPELFRPSAPPAPAGQGSRSTPPAVKDMNALIRQAAGRQ